MPSAWALMIMTLLNVAGGAGPSMGQGQPVESVVLSPLLSPHRLFATSNEQRNLYGRTYISAAVFAGPKSCLPAEAELPVSR